MSDPSQHPRYFTRADPAIWIDPDTIDPLQTTGGMPPIVSKHYLNEVALELVDQLELWRHPHFQAPARPYYGNGVFDYGSGEMEVIQQRADVCQAPLIARLGMPEGSPAAPATEIHAQQIALLSIYGHLGMLSVGLRFDFDLTAWLDSLQEQLSMLALSVYYGGPLMSLLSEEHQAPEGFEDQLVTLFDDVGDLRAEYEAALQAGLAPQESSSLHNAYDCVWERFLNVIVYHPQTRSRFDQHIITWADLRSGAVAQAVYACSMDKPIAGSAAAATYTRDGIDQRGNAFQRAYYLHWTTVIAKLLHAGEMTMLENFLDDNPWPVHDQPSRRAWINSRSSAGPTSLLNYTRALSSQGREDAANALLAMVRFNSCIDCTLDQRTNPAVFWDPEEIFDWISSRYVRDNRQEHALSFLHEILVRVAVESPTLNTDIAQALQQATSGSPEAVQGWAQHPESLSLASNLLVATNVKEAMGRISHLLEAHEEQIASWDQNFIVRLHVTNDVMQQLLYLAGPGDVMIADDFTTGGGVQALFALSSQSALKIHSAPEDDGEINLKEHMASIRRQLGWPCSELPRDSALTFHLEEPAVYPCPRALSVDTMKPATRLVEMIQAAHHEPCLHPDAKMRPLGGLAYYEKAVKHHEQPGTKEILDEASVRKARDQEFGRAPIYETLCCADCGAVDLDLTISSEAADLTAKVQEIIAARHDYVRGQDVAFEDLPELDQAWDLSDLHFWRQLVIQQLHDSYGHTITELSDPQRLQKALAQALERPSLSPRPRLGQMWPDTTAGPDLSEQYDNFTL